MKKVSVSNLRGDYIYISKGNIFLKDCECKLVENCGDGTGWFLGSRFTGTKNKIRCDFKEFEITDNIGNKIVPIQNF